MLGRDSPLNSYSTPIVDYLVFCITADSKIDCALERWHGLITAHLASSQGLACHQSKGYVHISQWKHGIPPVEGDKEREKNEDFSSRFRALSWYCIIDQKCHDHIAQAQCMLACYYTLQKTRDEE